MDNHNRIIENLHSLDGSKAAAVAMLAGCSREELDALGGVTEDQPTGGK